MPNDNPNVIDDQILNDNLVDDQIDDLEPDQEQEPKRIVADVLKEKGYEDKWQAESEEDRLRKVLDSYNEAVNAMKTREQENWVLRTVLNTRDQQIQQQQQLGRVQQPQSIQPQPVVDKETEAADKFIAERQEQYFKQKIEPELQRRDAEIARANAQIYLQHQYISNPVFKDLLDRGDLDAMVSSRLAPGQMATAELIDACFKDIVVARYPIEVQKAVERQTQQSDSLAKQKAGSFVEGGNRTRSNANPNDLEQFEKDIASMSYEDAIALARKRRFIR